MHRPDVVRIGFAIGMSGAIVAFAGAKARQRGRHRHARGGQRQIFEARNDNGVERGAPKLLLVAAEYEVALLGAHAFAFAPPAIVLQPRIGHGAPHGLAFSFKNTRPMKRTPAPPTLHASHSRPWSKKA